MAAAAAAAERRVEELLDALEGLVNRAKVMPVTHEVRLKRGDVYDILDQMRFEIVEIRDERALHLLQQLTGLTISFIAQGQCHFHSIRCGSSARG
jgi:hypothetical protein